MISREIYNADPPPRFDDLSLGSPPSEVKTKGLYDPDLPTTYYRGQSGELRARYSYRRGDGSVEETCDRPVLSYFERNSSYPGKLYAPSSRNPLI
jgi:hypothetical protein